MVEVQILYLDVGVVGHEVGCHLTFGIERNSGIAFQLDDAIAFTGGEVGSVARTVGLYSAVKGDTVRDMIVLHQLRVE